MVNRDNLFSIYIELNINCYTTFACAAFYFMETTRPMKWQQLIQITSQFDLKHEPRILNQNNDGPLVNKRIYIRCKPSNTRELRKQDG